jgi:F-box/WD-40 domain protein 7
MAANKKKIDINKATSEDFETLVGIGHAKAEAIVEARQVSSEHDDTMYNYDNPWQDQ